MMNGLAVFDERIVAIIRGLELDETLKTVAALRDGGIRAVEVPFDQTKDPKTTALKIEKAAGEFGGEDFLCGSGTVLNVEQVRLTHEAGGKLIVTPTSNREVILEAKRRGMFVMAGAMSATEVVNVYEWGADVVKIFPAGVLGTGYIKALQGPFPHIPLAAVGGITLDNIQDFCRAGVSMFGIGESIVKKDMIRQGCYEAVAELAGKYVERVKSSWECAR
ncbi:MAG: bifunctional 4-hydroxy-2-oxoglutarate aldolase/2-dehydro-3-deoxy-phosphogluconate aldolase [Lachnospiraceae bacterium]